MLPRPRTHSEHPAAVHQPILRAVDNSIIPARRPVGAPARELALPARSELVDDADLAARYAAAASERDRQAQLAPGLLQVPQRGLGELGLAVALARCRGVARRQISVVDQLGIGQVMRAHGQALHGGQGAAEPAAVLP
jgi:hypothetical protein